jgi:hypothetical protein
MEWKEERPGRVGGDRSSSKMVVSKRSLVSRGGRKMVWWVGDLPREIRVEEWKMGWLRDVPNQ